MVFSTYVPAAIAIVNLLCVNAASIAACTVVHGLAFVPQSVPVAGVPAALTNTAASSTGQGVPGTPPTVTCAVSAHCATSPAAFTTAMPILCGPAVRLESVALDAPGSVTKTCLSSTKSWYLSCSGGVTASVADCQKTYAPVVPSGCAFNFPEQVGEPAGFLIGGTSTRSTSDEHATLCVARRS